MIDLGKCDRSRGNGRAMIDLGEIGMLIEGCDDWTEKTLVHVPGGDLEQEGDEASAVCCPKGVSVARIGGTFHDSGRLHVTLHVIADPVASALSSLKRELEQLMSYYLTSVFHTSYLWRSKNLYRYNKVTVYKDGRDGSLGERIHAFSLVSYIEDGTADGWQFEISTYDYVTDAVDHFVGTDEEKREKVLQLGHRDLKIKSQARALGKLVDHCKLSGGLSEDGPVIVRTNAAGLEGSDCVLKELVFLILHRIRRGAQRVYSAAESRPLSRVFGFGDMHATDGGPHHEYLQRS